MKPSAPSREQLRWDLAQLVDLGRAREDLLVAKSRAARWASSCSSGEREIEPSLESRRHLQSSDRESDGPLPRQAQRRDSTFWSRAQRVRGSVREGAAPDIAPMG